MDDIGGNNMDSGIYRHKLWFLCLFFVFEIGSWDFPGAVELFGCGLWSWKSVWLVFWADLDVFSTLGGAVHGCFHGVTWLWHSVAPHQRRPHLALFPGTLSLSLSLENFNSNNFCSKYQEIFFNYTIKLNGFRKLSTLLWRFLICHEHKLDLQLDDNIVGGLGLERYSGIN